MWLTRSPRPFRFENTCDSALPYGDCEGLGLYVHIPFCESLCAFCPYCKVLYDEQAMDRYIEALLREIHLVGGGYPGKKRVTSLYFGGGTPALAASRIGEIIGALEEHFEITEGIGLELHPENVTPKTLATLQKAGVTKISIGIQSFQPKYQRLLGRAPVDREAARRALAEVPFETVSMDFIFALPGQTFEDLRADIDLALETGANHVAIYPFIDFTFTDSPIKALPKHEKRPLLDQITRYCLDRGMTRCSVWTFAAAREAGYSSMTRENFLGFGCSATTLLKDRFKVNTFSPDAYGERLEKGLLPTSLTLRFSPRQRMVYWLFWTLYSTGLRDGDFERFFGVPLRKMYGLEFRLAEKLGFVTREAGGWRLTMKGVFYYHYYENFYTLAYIDKMWGIMRREAWPEEISL